MAQTYVVIDMCVWFRTFAECTHLHTYCISVSRISNLYAEKIKILLCFMAGDYLETQILMKVDLMLNVALQVFQTFI